MEQKSRNLVADVSLAMIHYFGNDTRRIQHALKVHAYASAIGSKEIDDDEQLLILDIAALLHDIGIKEGERKHNSSSAKYQEIEGPAVARALLQPFQLNDRLLDEIAYIIGHHHTYSAINSIAFQVIVEADFFVNAFEESYSTDKQRAVGDKIIKTQTGVGLLNSQLQSASDQNN